MPSCFSVMCRLNSPRMKFWSCWLDYSQFKHSLVCNLLAGAGIQEWQEKASVELEATRPNRPLQPAFGINSLIRRKRGILLPLKGIPSEVFLSILTSALICPKITEVRRWFGVIFLPGRLSSFEKRKQLQLSHQNLCGRIEITSEYSLQRGKQTWSWQGNVVPGLGGLVLVTPEMAGTCQMTWVTFISSPLGVCFL